MEHLLDVSQVSKRFGTVQALHDVSFTVERGEVLGLVGPNGSGKTTLLHCIVGLTRPDSGSIRVAGVDHGLPRAKRRLGFMPDGLPRPEVLTGFELVELTSALHGRRLDPGWLEEMARQLDLDSRRLDHPLGTLSHGMGRKIDLLAALATEPDLLVLDEPSSGLDPLVSSRLESLVGTWPRNDRGVLLSTHDLGLAQRLCDRVVVLSRGRIVAAATVDGVVAIAGASDLRAAFVSLTGA